jgi:hypothetical protein
MRSATYFSPSDTCGKTGGCPEEDPRYPQSVLPSRGFSVLAFAFALAVTFLFIFAVVDILKSGGAVLTNFEQFVLAVKPEFWLTYIIYGAITGALISSIYNLMVVKNLNLFGLEVGIE